MSLAAAGGASASESGSSVVLVEEMTGAGAVTDTAAQWRIEGTDLGIMWDDGDGGVLTAFGDTFGDWSGDGGGGQDWRSNVLLRSTDTDLTDGMSFDWALEDAPGHAGEIVGSAKIPGEEHTVIPTAGIAIDGRQYLSAMSVREWGDPGQWWTNFAQLHYSDDGGQTWSSDGMPRWENDAEGSHPFQMHAFAHDGDSLYVFGTPNGRFGAAHLARVATDAVGEQDAYEYYTGNGWSAELADLEPLIEPSVAELSVHRDAETGRWLMVYLNEDIDLVLRTATTPTGPWTEPQVLASSADYPGLYGGYIHPWSASGELYLAMTLWGGYNVALMRAEYDADGQLQRPNLLADPSFERSTQLTGDGPWQLNGTGGIDVAIDQAKLGGHQFWLQDTQGSAELVQTVAVRPDTRYRLTCWLRTEGASGPGVLGARPASGSGGELAVEFTDLDRWQRVSGTVDSGGAESLEVYVSTSFDGEERRVTGDDCSLVEVAGGSAAGGSAGAGGLGTGAVVAGGVVGAGLLAGGLVFARRRRRS